MRKFEKLKEKQLAGRQAECQQMIAAADTGSVVQPHCWESIGEGDRADMCWAVSHRE